jgi:hypothetical protein
MEDESTAVVRFEVLEDGQARGRRAREGALELQRELARYLPDDVLEQPSAEDGAVRDKGDPITLGLLALAVIKSGVLAEVVRCVGTWLKRKPEQRSVVIRRADGTTLSVDATNIDDGSLTEAIKAAAATDRA